MDFFTEYSIVKLIAHTIVINRVIQLLKMITPSISNLYFTSRTANIISIFSCLTVTYFIKTIPKLNALLI